MAETFISFGVEKLWDLLAREAERFQEVKEQFNGLKDDLSMLRCFLKDVDAKKHTSEMVRNVVKDINEIIFDAEDIIETFLLKEDLGKTSGIKKSVKRLACVVVDRRELSSEIRAISQRIDKVIRHMQSLGIQQSIVNETYRQPPQEIQRELRQTFWSDKEDHLVGLEKKVEIVIGYLVEEDSSQVVSITGMGGLGKTTLARQVFNHETIKSHFPRLAWVCVSQQFTRKYVWQSILRQLMPEYKVSEMGEDELQEKLVGVLETQKALIVIDDIWREGDWDRIKQVFLLKKGWKILLTSRNEGVALHADPKCITFKPECMTFEESWDLFQMIAFPETTEYKVDEKMEEMGKEMIKHCGGLPLAVKVLGGLLAVQYTLRDWTRVSENIKPQILGGISFNDRNVNSVYNILYLSYEELPIYLKHCFLYLAHFPEDYAIQVKKLAYYWAAEGIPRPEYYDGASVRDVADGYIEELVKRNMVMSKRECWNSGFKICQLHDMMREVCLLKAKEENFVQCVEDASSASSQLPCKSRRLAIHKGGETFRLNNPSLRSLLHIEAYNWKASSGLCFKRLLLMRVLDLSWVKFEGGKVLSSIGKLIHLRYLSLYWAYVTHLPSSIRNLRQLIYLNLCCRDNILMGDNRAIYVPNFFKEMRGLTYLYFPMRLHDNVKLELGNLVNLESLQNFSTKHGNVRDLQGMTRLRFLSIYTEGRGNLSFPSGLTIIILKNSRLEDPIPILEKLLHLKEVSFFENAFGGKRMACSRGGFPQLQTLQFNRLSEWEEWKVEEGSMPLLRDIYILDCENLEEWIVEEGSMPLLQTLVVSFCPKLTELRDGLRFITSLKDVNVTVNGEEWKNRFSEEHLPSHLTTITLQNFHLEEDPMPILEKLLHLKKVTLSDESFCGSRMVCSRGGFPQLQQIEFYKLQEWEEWIIEEGSMPLLHTLKIKCCKKLKELPDGLRFITSLKGLEMDAGWKEKLSEGGEEYYKVQHIPSVIISDKYFF